jgi:hypothetical protein
MLARIADSPRTPWGPDEVWHDPANHDGGAGS